MEAAGWSGRRVHMCTLMALLLADPLGAQADEAIACDGLPVQAVVVETNRPEFRGMLAWWRKFARAAGLHHETTSPALVRRYVSLVPGRPCTEFRRRESERILRAQPFLADATVRTSRVGDSVRVNVTTVDEVPVLGGTRLRGATPQALSVGTINLLGWGMHTEGRWSQQRGLRQGAGGVFTHPQLFGRPYLLALEGERLPLGEYFTGAVSHAFLTDLQRIAWHAGYSMSKDFARLWRQDGVQLFQPLDRAMWSVGGVLRFGLPRKLGLVGGVILGERLAPSNQWLVEDTATGQLVPTLDTAGVREYSVYDAINVAGVIGVRSLSFTRMQGLDALVAEQDVATGSQVATILGWRPGAEAFLQNAFASLDAYVGGRSERHFVAGRAEVQSRFDLEGSDWNQLVIAGRIAWYFKPRPLWTSELSVEGAGAWRTIIPLQFELGDRRGGVRGYASAHEPGGQRLLARLEHRFDVARWRKDRAAFGVGAFVDAGRMWAGDVPFGANTPIRVAVGTALLAAVPAQSQRTMRAELALPLDHSEGARPEVRFAVRVPAQGFWFDPPGVQWARLSRIPEQIFRWP